jgi:ferredoxin
MLSARVSFSSLPGKGLNSMPKVEFTNEKKQIEVPVGANLRQEALKAGVQVYKGLHRYINCMGHGLCGTCKVLVKKGMENLSPKGRLERFTLATSPTTALSIIGHEDEMRLSCQVQINGDCTIETRPAFNWSGDNFWQKPYPNK